MIIMALAVGMAFLGVAANVSASSSYEAESNLWLTLTGVTNGSNNPSTVAGR